MKQVLVFSDIHMRSQGETIIGLDPFARFQQAMSHAIASYPDADHVVLLGDLTNSGKQAEYRRVQEVLAGCPLPWSLIPGNHDNRNNIMAVFSDLPHTKQGHLQSVVDLGQDRLIMLDTLDGPPFRNDYHVGFLCPARIDWLKQILAESGAQRINIFSHHPAFATGIRAMDKIPLKNGAELLALLAQHPTPTHIFSGHVHRTISGSANGQGFSMFKSTCHQTPLILRDGDESMSVAEPAAYGVVLLMDNVVVAHSEEFQHAIHDTTPQPEALPE